METIINCSPTLTVTDEKLKKMLRLSVLALLLAAVWAAPTTENTNSAGLEVVVVDSIEEYLAKNPAIEFAQEMETEYLQDRYQLRHSFGRRVGGDRQVANNNYSQQYPTQQDVKATLNYPTQGVGSIVTFIQIVVDQVREDSMNISATIKNATLIRNIFSFNLTELHPRPSIRHLWWNQPTKYFRRHRGQPHNRLQIQRSNFRLQLNHIIRYIISVIVWKNK